MIALLEPLRIQFDLNTRLFLNALEGMEEAGMLQRPSPRTNHAAFIAVHLIDARHYLGRSLGLAIGLPFGGAFERVRGIDDAEAYPSLLQIRTAWRRASGRVAAAFEGLTEEEVRSKAEGRFPVADETLLGVMAFLLQHEAYHIGQLALLRKEAGLKAMRYG